MAEQSLLPFVGRDLMTVAQVARYLERSADRVRQYADAWDSSDPDSPGLKHMRLGPKGERMFSPEDVRRFKRELEADRLMVEACRFASRMPRASRRG